MVSARQELHNLIDNMSEQEASTLLLQVQSMVLPAQVSLADWLEEARALGQELQDKYGERSFPSTVDILDEIREERLNDLMGGE